MCVSVLPACLLMYHVHAGCLQWPEEGIIFPRIGVKDSCEPPWILGIKPGSSVKVVSALGC